MALRFSVIGVPGIPMVESGDDLSEIISSTLKAQDLTLEDGDVICLAQKGSCTVPTQSGHRTAS